MTTIRAHFDGKVLVPHEHVDLPVNEEVTIQLAPASPQVVQTEADLLRLFAEMGKHSVKAGHFVDYSRDSIYDGSLDDPH